MEIFLVDTDWKRRALIEFSLSREGLATIPVDPADLGEIAPTERQIFLICDEEDSHELLGRVASASYAFCYSTEFQLRNVVETLKLGAKDYFAWPDDLEVMVDRIRKRQEQVASRASGIDRKPVAARYSDQVDHPRHGRADHDHGAGGPLHSPQEMTRQRSSLSSRELEVLELASYGLSSKSIAERLGIRRKTVDAHRNNILNKSRCSNMTEAVRWGIMGRMI